MGLFVAILPYLEQVNIYNLMDLTKSYRDTTLNVSGFTNAFACATSIPSYMCPSNPYTACVDPAGFGGLDYFASVYTDISDGSVGPDPINGGTCQVPAGLRDALPGWRAR